MATFYKYAERQAADYVNWAEISKNATNVIAEETKIREEKKAAIDEEARQLFLKLAEPPTGDDASYSDKAIKFATVAQEQKLSDLRLLKSGKLNLQEYLSRSQNLLDGTGIAFNLFKEYQDEYKVKMDRMNSADPNTRSQMVEQALMADTESYGNLNNMDILVDPNTGRVNLGKKELDKATGIYKFTSVLPVSQARARIKGKYNYFNSDAATTNIEKNLGENINTLRKFGSQTRSGQLTKIEDKKELENYEDAERKFIDTQLSNPLNMSSVLTNDLNEGYYPVFTKEAAAKDPKAIYFKTNASGLVTPEFTDEQKKKAFDYMQTTLRGKIDRKVTAEVYGEQQKPRPTEPEIARGITKQQELEGAGYWNEIYAAPTQEKKKSAIEKFLGTKGAIDAGLIGMDLESSPGQAKLIFKDPSLNRTVTYNNMSINDWADKNEFTSVLSREEKRRIGGSGDYGYGFYGTDEENARATKGLVVKRQGAPERPTAADPYAAMSQRLNQGIKSDIFMKKEDDAASALSDALSGIATVEGVGIINDVVKVTFNGKTKEFLTDLKQGSANNVSNNVKAWILGEYRKLSPQEQAKLSGFSTEAP